jgi:N-dimethylarginine dimethylaminohydrolase
MLSEQEKKEMLQDARNTARRDSFRATGLKVIRISFDEYIKALDELQCIFSAFKPSAYIAPTSLNKL